METRFELLLGTRNEGKVVELIDAFSDLSANLRFLREFPNITDVEEIGVTYEENATLKASGYALQTGISALADDSGLEVDALGGQPGVLSARFGGNGISDIQRTQVLLEALANIDSGRRTARFVCCMVLVGRSNQELKVLAASRGICEGSISTVPAGKDGFGFDPVFIPNGYKSSFAALDPAVKARLSHRAKAAKQMRQKLEHLFAQT
jgi:XTP/dITP diphosphohydrolase